MIFCRPNVGLSLLPELKIVDCFKLLGIFVSVTTFNQSQYIEFILSICEQRLYLLKILRHNGLCPNFINRSILYFTQSLYLVLFIVWRHGVVL